jgi:uncharacterized protein (TIGR03067 family)
MRFFIGMFLLFAVTLPAYAADAKTDRQKYSGTWQAVSGVSNGNTVKDEDARKIVVINEADGKWTILVEGKVFAKGTSKMNPSAKPKAIDITCTEGDPKGKTYLGIYEVGENTRKVCLAEAGKERPTDFSSKEGSGNILVHFQRVKK